MSVIKIKKPEKYTIIANDVINNSKLTWEARGLLVYLLSKPNNWTVRVTDLTNQSPSGVKVIRRLIKELSDHGYISRERKQDPETKQFTWDTTVREEPILPLGIDGSGIDGSGVDIVFTDSLNTNIKEEESEPQKSQNVYRLYENNIGVMTPIIAEQIQHYEKECPDGWIQEAVKIAANNGARNWAYIKTILDKWLTHGYGYDGRPKKQQQKNTERMKRGFTVDDRTDEEKRAEERSIEEYLLSRQSANT